MSGTTAGWLDVLVRLQQAREPAVMVTVVATRGSAPREAGTRMIVTVGDVDGTIGGGHLELQAISIARDQLAGAAAPAGRLRRFPLGASLGQCCGGVVNLIFEPIAGEAPWIEDLKTLRDTWVPAVVVSAADDTAVDARLIVTAATAIGTLGTLDAPAMAVARRMLDERAAARLERCGNDDAPLLFFDPVRGPAFRIVLFGAGHVGRALVRMLGDLDCHVTWVDERQAEFPREVPSNVDVLCTDAPDAEVDAAPPGSYFLVMTHSHALDEALAERILRRGDFAYFGLIGSITKRRQFERRLARRGMDAARLAGMTCPIGIAGIDGKEPATIAVAVAAQLLQVRATAAARERRPADTGPTTASLSCGPGANRTKRA